MLRININTDYIIQGEKMTYNIDTNWMPPGRYGVNDAINSLRPGAMYQLENTTFNKWWHHQNAPTWDEIIQESERLKREAYKQMRVEEYPSLAEFADAYYWQTKGNDKLMEHYLERVKQVKEKYPKPTEEQLK
jgi:hypothetical protein